LRERNQDSSEENGMSSKVDNLTISRLKARHAAEV